MKNNLDVIDLCKSTRTFEQVQQFVNNVARQSILTKSIVSSQIKLVFQFIKLQSPPQLYTLNLHQIVVGCNLNDKSGQLILSEDFFKSPSDFQSIFKSFITFLYCSSLKYNNREDNLTFTKLSVVFECEELLTQLLKRISDSETNRNSSFPFLVYLLNSKFFQNQDPHLINNFITKLLAENSSAIVNHLTWNEDEKNKMSAAITSITPTIFEQFAKRLYANDGIKELTYLLYYIGIYKNPNLFELELIYLETVIEIMDEDFFVKYQGQMTDSVFKIAQKQIDKIKNKKVCHFVRSKVCDLNSKTFKAHCGHFICLNCFFEYFLYKILVNDLFEAVIKKFKVKCFSTLIHQDICNTEFNESDFKNLECFFPKGTLNNFINK